MKVAQQTTELFTTPEDGIGTCVRLHHFDR
jgi:hypothetical protein